jgi:PAS domain S-box-containing protein
VLQSREARFLSTASLPHELLAANKAFTDIFSLTSRCIQGYSLKSLYSDVEGYSLLEEIMQRAASGVESECAISLPGHSLPMHMRACPVMDYGVCLILCIVTPIEYCTEILSHTAAQSILSCKSPCHLVDANEEWCAAWGFSKEEVVGRSIKLLQGPKTNEQVLAELLDAARKGLEKECEIIAYTKRGTECAVHLRSRPIFRQGSPITHFVIEAKVMSSGPSPTMQSQDVCDHMTSLRIHDGLSPDHSHHGYSSDADYVDFDEDEDRIESPAERPREFSELILALPPETHHFCLQLLWRLREQALVQAWCWEDGMLRVRADTEALTGLAGIEGSCSNVWLLRLIEAAYRLDLDRVRRAGGAGVELAAESYDSPKEEAATDFSFLCGDGGTSPIEAA